MTKNEVIIIYMKKLSLLLCAVMLCFASCVEEESGRIELSQQTVEAEFEFAKYEVEVTATCSWKAKSENSWITIFTDAGSAGTEVLKFYVAQNNEEQIREGAIVVENDEHNIVARLVVVQHIFQPSEIVANPESLTFSFGGGKQEVAITTNFDYEYSTEVDWLSIEKSKNGINVTAAYNGAETERSADITISSAKYGVSKVVKVSQEGLVPGVIAQLAKEPFYYENPESRTPAYTVASEAHRLSFFGWGEQTDKAFQMVLPSDVAGVDRVLLEYRMGAWGNRPGEWDNTTMLFVEDKATGERYEITRAISPYGNSFNSTWSKTFWLDVTEYLPLLSGETTFYLYYGGWDATDSRAHTATVTLNYYKGEPKRNVVFIHELYDSSRDGNSGYRGWAYGVAGYDIEDVSRLGERTVVVPESVKSLEIRVAITGHGHDQGTFVERIDYHTLNAAEFDENFYEFVYNGVRQSSKGHIFFENSTTYPQAGTYIYDRANWGPGLPINVQYWTITPSKEDYGTITLDMDLEEFVSAMTAPNAEGVAQYIVQVNLFGFDK